MEMNDRLQVCSECSKKKLDMSKGMICSITNEKPCFDGECPDFERTPSMEKSNELTMNCKKNASISGFLWFYIYICVLPGSILTFLNSLLNLDSSESVNLMLTLSDLVSSLAFASIGIYSSVAFIKRLPNAVTLAKIQIVLHVVINCLVLVVEMIMAVNQMSIIKIIFLVIWSCVLYLYMCYSDQVKARIPVESRHLYKVDKVVLLVLLGLYIFLFTGGAIRAFEII